MDPAFYEKKNRTAREQAADTPLFAPPPEPAEAFRRSNAPAAPGSRSSQRGADAAEKSIKGQNFTILLTLASASAPLSREALSERTGIKESSLCGRLDSLTKLDDKGRQWVECVKDACTSKAGVAVNGYRITEVARAHLRGKGVAA